MRERGFGRAFVLEVTVKRVCGSNCKDPENRSKKKCCCGGHSLKAKKPRKKNHRS